VHRTEESQNSHLFPLQRYPEFVRGDEQHALQLFDRCIDTDPTQLHPSHRHAALFISLFPDFSDVCVPSPFYRHGCLWAGAALAERPKPIFTSNQKISASPTTQASFADQSFRP
jgi:hypothetical protein